MPLTARYMAATRIARDVGSLAREFFAHRSFMFGGSASPPDFAGRSLATLRTAIVRKLAEAFPGDAILDDVLAGGAARPISRAWVIDPIGGIRNFARGIPLYSVSIAYLEQGRCEIGVIYDPQHDDLFHARRGEGGYCEHGAGDAPIDVAACEALDGAVICVADEDGGSESAWLAVERELRHHGASVRATGAPALELAHVAAGRCDGFLGVRAGLRHLHAGMLLVEEAGGCTLQPAVADAPRADAPVLACAPGIASVLTELVSAGSAWRAEPRPADVPRLVH